MEAAEMARDAALAEIARLRGSGEHTEPLPEHPTSVTCADDTDFTTDIEMTRLAQTLAELKRDDHERWARHICAALNYVQSLDRELRRETGRDRRATRQIGPFRRQGKRAEVA
jgi:hypothetical protein